MAKLMGEKRAIILAQLTVQIEQSKLASAILLHGGKNVDWTAEQALEQAEEILTAAENLVAKKYGEYR